MEETKKKPTPKIAKKFLIIGCIIIAIGLVLIGLSVANIHKIVRENDIKNEKYKIELNEYNDRFSQDPTDVNNHFPDPPETKIPTIGILLCFGSFAVLAVGFIFAGRGLTPYVSKIDAKLGKETLDYAGDDISAAGVKMVEVSEPIINKGVDVIASNIEKISRSTKKVGSNTKDNKVNHCIKCGKKMDVDEAYCRKCGTKHVNVCECGQTNDSDDMFCGKCGRPLK